MVVLTCCPKAVIPDVAGVLGKKLFADQNFAPTTPSARIKHLASGSTLEAGDDYVLHSTHGFRPEQGKCRPLAARTT